jgi:hypothetical protein
MEEVFISALDANWMLKYMTFLRTLSKRENDQKPENSSAKYDIKLNLYFRTNIFILKHSGVSLAVQILNKLKQ